MISEKLAEEVLGTALKKGGEWGDLFIEESSKNVLQFSEQKIKNMSEQQLSGAGLRLVADQKEYYAYTNDLSSEGLLKMAKKLSDVLPLGSQRQVLALEEHSVTNQHLVLKSPAQVQWQDKIDLLKRADQKSRAVSEKVKQVNVNYVDESQRIAIYNSEGLFKSDLRTRGRFAVTAIAENASEKQAGYEAPGASRGFEFFENLDIEQVAHEAATSALRMLDASYAPKGQMPVIIDSAFGGVIFHEACGHSLEASAVAKKATVFADQLGKKIASDIVSAVDDGTLRNEWGSLNIDDEGQATQRNLLIENGILKSFLVDRLNGERIGQSATGSSRRQSYRFAPTSRMTNTFILAGKSSLASMIQDTEQGLYAKKLGGGSVNPSTGEFNFAVSEGYLIKNGKLGEAVRGAVLIGKGHEILKKIDRVGKELKLAQGICGAASGWIPVDVGQPAIRVQGLLVGGR